MVLFVFFCLLHGWDYIKTMLKFIVIHMHVKMIIDGLRFIVDFIFGSGERGCN